jgi:transposase
VVTDTRSVLKHLAPEDHEFCLRLADGMSIDAIAAQLGCGWHTVRRRIDRLRAEFERQGFDGPGR